MRHIRWHQVTDPLYAKSPSGGHGSTLIEHSRAVLEASRHLFGHQQPTGLGNSWMRLFGVPAEQFPSFTTNLALATIFHDIGKANNGFQLAITRKGEQVIRHEHLSALILWLPEMRAWLESCPDCHYETILSAVLCHHLKVDDTTHFLHSLKPVDEFTVHCAHPDIAEILRMAEPIIGSPAPDLSHRDGKWAFDEIDGKGLKAHLYHSKRVLKDIAARNMYLAVKAGLIAADAAGSGLLREGKDMSSWISGCMEQPRLTPDDIEELVIAPRMRQVEQRTIKTFTPRTFQTEVGKLGPRALLLAGCGAGKTFAAWKWVQHQAETHGFSRVLFLYPTRATATEGFRDYVSWAGADESALLHGTSDYDLTGMFTNPSDDRSGQDYTAEQRLYALGYWPKRVFSATVDSFLSFMAHSYSSICMLPVLADSVIIIDEVHSFDRSMFTSLEQFLKAFPTVPVLCMTASLTTDRLNTLTDGCGLELFPHGEIDDLKRQTGAPRYMMASSDGEPGGAVREALLAGKKVLWVVNTVNRCQEIFAEHAAFCSGRQIPATCYHSRFRLKDRKQRHEEVICLFREHSGAALVVTTQVCEMSLDLDADMLVTETAPVPAIIQRMGRCCRVEYPGDRRGMVIIYTPPDNKPYDREEILQCEDFVRHLAALQEVSQDDLADYLSRHDVGKPHIEGGYTGFLDSGWYAMGSDDTFRDGLDTTVDCILDGDQEEFKRLKVHEPESLAGLVVPVPKKFADREQLAGNRFPIAPSSNYDPLTGFCKQEVPHG
jgi:CRISPR-associated endonuclease/helicase Cas3